MYTWQPIYGRISESQGWQRCFVVSLRLCTIATTEIHLQVFHFYRSKIWLEFFWWEKIGTTDVYWRFYLFWKILSHKLNCMWTCYIQTVIISGVKYYKSEIWSGRIFLRSFKVCLVMIDLRFSISCVLWWKTLWHNLLNI